MMQQPFLHTYDHGSFTVTGLPAFADNYIWVLASHLLGPSSRIVIVDPGDAAPVIHYCRQQGLVPDQVWLTHHHADHAGGVADLQDWVIGQGRHLSIFGPTLENINGVNHALSGGEIIDAGPLGSVSVLSVPGHTRGHLAYFIPAREPADAPALFSGDVLFGLGCGRLFEGSAAQMYASLQQISALPMATRIYCAHEYTLLNLPFAQAVDPNNPELVERAAAIRSQRADGAPTVPLLLKDECATNPFLRADYDALAHAVSSGSASLPPAEVFARLRAMRDNFKANP